MVEPVDYPNLCRPLTVSPKKPNVVSILGNGVSFRSKSRHTAEMLLQVRYGHKWKTGLGDFCDYMKALRMLRVTDDFCLTPLKRNYRRIVNPIQP